jgi:uncharacterized membrane protein
MEFVKQLFAMTISWMVVGTAVTMALSWLITGSFEAGVQIGVADITTKMLLYYLHERAWVRDFGSNPNLRHLLKIVSSCEIRDETHHR